MKKRIIYLFLIGMGIFPAKSYAQSLEFSRVLLKTVTNPSTVNDTVPAGKTWKVESAVSSDILGYGIMHLNGQSSNLFRRSSPSWDAFPFWIPAGTVVRFESSGAGAFIHVSIIEFNIVP